MNITNSRVWLLIFVFPLFVGCKDDRVERLDTNGMRLTPDYLISSAMVQVDKTLTAQGYMHTQAESPFNVGYVRGDTSFFYFLTDTSMAGMVVAVQMRDLKRSATACLRDYAEKSTFNNAMNWATWRGDIMADTMTRAYSSHATFFMDLATLPNKNVTTFHISEEGESRLLQCRLTSMPVASSVYANTYILNLKN